VGGIAYATENEHATGGGRAGVGLQRSSTVRRRIGQPARHVKKLLDQSPKLVMNLREVNYIDSGGLGTLVSLYTTARNAGGAMKLASVSRNVGDLLNSPSCILF